MRTLRIFVSSPADVSYERARAKQVLEKLAIEFAGRMKLEPFFWEHEPMRATDTFNGTDNIPLTSDFDIVVCILWSRLGSLLGDAFRRPDGTRYPSGTVFEMEVARDSYIRSKAPDLLVYRKTEEISLPLENRDLREQKLRQFEALDQFIQDWFFDTDNTFKSALNSYKKVSQFENLVEQHLRRLIEQKISQDAPAPADGAVDGRVGFGSYHGGNPFRGLEPFEFKDRGLFFGRSLAIEETLDALRKQADGGFPLVVVHGVSGSGKSSLVRAGVVPVLMEPGVAEGIGLWKRAEMRPSDAAEGVFPALAKALLEKEALPELAKSGWDAVSLAKALADEPEKVAVAIAQALMQASADVQSDENLPVAPGSKLVLVIDQFEEIFSDERKISEGDRKRLEATLVVLLKSGAVWSLMTMRSDRMGKFAELGALAEGTRQHGQVALMAPSEADLSLMIRLPARAAGLDFEQLVPSGERLEDRLLKEARSAPDGLPLLGFVLQSLYEKMPEDSRVLMFSALEELGGLEGAVASRAEAAFGEFTGKLGNDGEARTGKALSKLTRMLTTLSEDPDAPPLRRIAEIGEGGELDRDALIEHLVERRLLTKGLASGGGATVHVSHEAIFRKWPRLAELIEKDRKFLGTRRTAQAAAARWEARGRKPEFLWNRGAMLADVKFLLANGETLDAQEREFANASVTSAGKRKVRNIGFAACAAAACAAVFFLIPEKVIKRELSDAEKAKIKAVEDRKILDGLEAQLAAAMVELDKLIWPDPAVESADEEWIMLTARYPELDVAEIARRIIAIEPTHNAAWKAMLLADIAAAGKTWKDDPEGGDRLFKEIEKRLGEWGARGLPKDELLDLKARIAWMSGDKGEAANLWATYLKTPGLDLPAKRRLYDTLSANRIEGGKLREAGALLDDWLELEDNAVARARRAKLRLAELDFKAAQEDIGKAVDLQPNLAEVRDLVPVVERAVRYAAQIEAATAAIDKAGPRGGIEERCMRARHLIAIEQFAAAKADLNEAAKRMQGKSKVLEILQAIVTVRSGGNVGEDSKVNPSSDWAYDRGCEKYLDENWVALMGMLKLDAAMWAAPGKFNRLMERGWALWTIGQTKMSLDDANKALEISEGDMNARMLRIASNIYVGQEEAALSESEECLLIAPQWSGIHRFKAEALMKLNRTPEALAPIEEACRLSPEIPLFHEMRAQCLQALERKEEAEAALRRAVELRKTEQ